MKKGNLNQNNVNSSKNKESSVKGPGIRLPLPELQRILALKGAKLIVGLIAADHYYTLPNGERSKVPYPDISKILIPANAYANNIFFAYSKRAGYEKRGKDQWHSGGNSIVCGLHGDII